MPAQIENLSALEILDSRGNPTLEVEVALADGTRARAQVPSGASTGRHEARELRDGSGGAYGGKSVRRAAAHVEGEITSALRGCSVEDQRALDLRLCELDGTENKARLGANALLGVSAACARAAASASGRPLWESLAGDRRAVVPVPMVNVLSGGLHAGGQLDFQDFLAVPHGFETFAESLEAVVAVHRAAQELILAEGYTLTGVADEGGLGPRLESNEQALDLLLRAVEHEGLRPGEQVSIALDVAASHFFEDGSYRLRSEQRRLSPEELIDLLDGWARRYPILSIEDGLAEDDWDGWRALTERLGQRCRLIGDDLFCTNPKRLQRGIETRAANAVLVKMNQIGTLTETFEVIDRAREAGFGAVVSARSGETEDDFLADLAVASGCGQIKVGSITRSERLAKYNRLLWIERLGGPAPFAEARNALVPGS